MKLHLKLIVIFKFFNKFIISFESLYISYYRNAVMVAFWILDTYPMHAPICYIQPDNSFGIKNKVFSRLNSADVEINISKYVDGNGKLYLPYILEWKPKTSNIVEVIKDYKHQFVEQSPIFLRSQGRPQPSQPPRETFEAYQNVEELLSSNALEEITSRKLHFLLGHSYGYIIDAFSKNVDEGQRKNDLRKAMEIWHPDKFFPRFGHRIPNEEELNKIKTIVNHVSAALISGYQK